MKRKSRIQTLAAAAVAVILACSGCSAGAGTDKPADKPGATATTAPTLLRWVVFPGTDSEFLPKILESKGIAAKYGIKIETLSLANSNFQTALQGGSADLAQNGLISAVSLPAKGLDIKVVGSFEGYGNYLMSLPDGPKSVSELKGKTLGAFSNTQIDFTVLRAVAKKLYGFDLVTDTKVVPAAPGLLSQLLTKKEVDAVLQFSSIGFTPVQRKELTNIATVSALIKQAGWDTKALNLVYLLAPQWMQANPGKAQKVADMIVEGQNFLQTDDSVWPDLSTSIAKIPEDLVGAYMKETRLAMSTEYSPGAVESTRKLFGSLLDVLGPDGFAGGPPEVPSSMFIFPTKK
ncbi:MAG: ABC transporter substrate-binding protein [Terrimesophilobacter sp.]